MFYVPTHFALRDQQRSTNPPYAKQDADIKDQRVKAKKKGKGKAAAMDQEFEKERRWLIATLHKEAVEKEGAATSATVPAHTDMMAVDDDDDNEEGGIECGCCFTEYPFVGVIFV